MATSNSTNYTQTRDEIISDSLSLLGVLGAGQTATANDITFCSSLLNKMIKAWQAQGIHLWKECEAVIPLVINQNTYTLSSTSTDRMGDTPIETVLTVASSGGSLTVSSTVGMTALDKIGVQLDASTRHWTTIASVDSTTTLTLTVSLTSTASIGNSVTTYTTTSNRPLNITNARYRYNSGVERKITKYGRAQFMALPNKNNTGTVTAFYYTPQLNNGVFYVWNTPDTSNDNIHCTYIKTFEDFDSSSDNADFPQEWLECLTLNLACRIAPAYGKSLSQTQPDLVRDAQMSLLQLNGWDSEEGSVKFMPSRKYDD